MAIKRISDLTSVLNIGKKSDGTDLVMNINTAILQFVTKKSNDGEEYTVSDTLKESLFEISWPKAVNNEKDNFTNFESKSISYNVLSTFMLLYITNETYTFYGTKTFNNSIIINHTGKNTGNNIVDKVEIIESELFLNNTNLCIDNGVLSADLTDANIESNGNFRVYAGNKTTNNNTLNINNNEVTLSSSNKINIIAGTGDKSCSLTLNGSTGTIEILAKKINFKYAENVQFNKINTDDDPVFSISFNSQALSGKQDIVKFPKSDATNPIEGCIKNALWA